MAYFAGKCEVAVIGAGHAGIEAALASARLGLHTILFTINLDAVGNMPCNPAQGIQLPDQVALSGAADGRVAGHIAYGVQIEI